MASGRFVCVINRARDGYEVPLALHQAGLLERFVTDFYTGSEPPRWYPAPLRRRHCQGLPEAMVTTSRASFLVQVIADRVGLPMRRVFPFTDRLLARKAIAVASKNGADLYCYGGYLPRPGEVPSGAKVIDFEFHPHPDFGFALLEEDAALYPEVAWSFARERESHAREVVRSGWQEADAVVCASSVTARSFEAAGCPAERIQVIPYGCPQPAAVPPPRPDGPCRFLFVGQGIQRKGLHHLVRCWRDISPGDAELTLVCYAIDPGIRVLLQDSGIRLLGRRSGDELAALYAASDVFVMPSMVEGFGLVYLEALAAGCHVIATANTGVADLALDEQATTLVAPGDLAGLKGAIEKQIAAKQNGLCDPAVIVTQAAARSWTDFRTEIAAHARRVVDD